MTPRIKFQNVDGLQNNVSWIQ